MRQQCRSQDLTRPSLFLVALYSNSLQVQELLQVLLEVLPKPDVQCQWFYKYRLLRLQQDYVVLLTRDWDGEMYSFLECGVTICYNIDTIKTA